MRKFAWSSRTFLINFRGEFGSVTVRIVGPFVEPLLKRFMVLDLDTRNLVIEGDAGESAAHRTVHDRIIVIHKSSIQGMNALANFFLRSAEFFFAQCGTFLASWNISFQNELSFRLDSRAWPG